MFFKLLIKTKQTVLETVQESQTSTNEINGILLQKLDVPPSIA